MKFINKDKLYIAKDSNGCYDIKYDENVVFNYAMYDNMELKNIETTETFLYKDLVLCLSKENDVYLYPESLYTSKKLLKEYHIKNWFFVDDKELTKYNYNMAVNDMSNLLVTSTNTLQSVATDLAKLSKDVNTFVGNITQVTNNSLPEITNTTKNITQSVSNLVNTLANNKITGGFLQVIK